jgi:hypothetical protein
MEGGGAPVSVEGHLPGAGGMACATRSLRASNSIGFPTMAKAPSAGAWRDLLPHPPGDDDHRHRAVVLAEVCQRVQA